MPFCIINQITHQSWICRFLHLQLHIEFPNALGLKFLANILLIKLSFLEGEESFNQRKTIQIVKDIQVFKSLKQTFYKLTTFGNSLGLSFYFTY